MEIYRHGELILKPITKIPDEAKLVRSVKEEVVAHSETGHNHVLIAENDFKIYSLMDDTFIEIPTTAELRHQKTGKDVHKTHKIAPALYKVLIKREFDYFKDAIVRVRD